MAPPRYLPFGEWLPDQPDFDNPGARTITNVVPLTAQSYGPIASPGQEAEISPLPARVQGAYGFLDAAAGVHLFVGTATHLYQLTAGTTSFADISRTVGGAYSLSSTLDPATPTTPFWSMTSFGERIIATDYADPPQTFLVGTDTNFSALSSGAPKARYAATIKDFVVLGYTNEATGGVQPRRVWWSAIGDPLSWPTPGTNAAVQVQSDYQDLEQSDLGQITGVIGGFLASAHGAVFCERGIYSVQYVGAAGGIFSFQVAEGAAGTQAPLSIVQRRMQTPYGNRAVAFYLGTDGFYAFDGMSSLPIGSQKIDRTFFADLDPAYLSAVQGIHDPTIPLVYWLYNPLSGAGAGFYERMLVYNTVIGRWSLCDLSASPIAWGTRALSFPWTLDQLNAFSSLDSVSPGLDSSRWTGGRPQFALFNQINALCFLEGQYLAPIVETSEVELFPGRRAKIISARPLCEGGIPAVSPSVAIATRDRMIDAPSLAQSVAINSIGECPQRRNGRYVRARLTLPQTFSAWNHLQGVQLDARPEGRR